MRLVELSGVEDYTPEAVSLIARVRLVYMLIR